MGNPARPYQKGIFSMCAEGGYVSKDLQETPIIRTEENLFGAVQPKMEYACAVLCRGPIGKLVKLQEIVCRQARVSLPPLKRRFDYPTLLLFYKIRSEVAPTYLSSFLHPPLSSSGYKLRKMSYPVPNVSTKSIFLSFLPRPIMLWNDLPSELQKTPSLSIFKNRLRYRLNLKFSSSHFFLLFSSFSPHINPTGT